MPIDDLTPSLRELGRIRIGQRVPAKGGKDRPTKLDTFRLTSRSQALVTEAAMMFGGEARPWHNPSEGDQFEVVTERDELQILLPPPFQLDQHYELWSGGGLNRRCTGRVTYDGEDCLCPKDIGDRMDAAAANPPTACKPTTRLKVIVRGLSDFGAWRLETHGYYAALELMGSMKLLEMVGATRPVPAILRLEQRAKKVAGKPNIRYAVPVIEMQASLDRVLESTGVGTDAYQINDRPHRQLRAAQDSGDSSGPSEETSGGGVGTKGQTDLGKGPEAPVLAPPEEEAASGGGVAHGPAVDTEAAAAPARPPATVADIKALMGILGVPPNQARQKLGMAKPPEDLTQTQLDAWRRNLENKANQGAMA